MAGGERCRGRRGRRLRDELVVNSTLSPGLKLGHVVSLRWRTVGRVGPGLVLVLPGARASGSPLLPGWVPGVRPPCGGSTGDRSAERRVWVAWPRRHLGPGDVLCLARGKLPSIRRGECREVPGLPPAEGPSAELCPAATSVMVSESAFLCRKPLVTLQVGHRECARPCGALRHLGFRVVPAVHNGPAASSKATAVQAPQRLIAHVILFQKQLRCAVP